MPTQRRVTRRLRLRHGYEMQGRMRPLIAKGFVCSAEMEVAPSGRPRLYCSDACRLRAEHRRRAARLVEPKVAGKDPSDYAGMDIEQLLGPVAERPDEAVYESVILARSVASQFAAIAPFARPEFGWRCEAMAQHIAAGVKRWFEP